MPLSAIDAISPAFNHTKQQVFQPFRLSQWWRLATVGFLAGEMSSSGSCNRSSFNWPQQGTHASHLLGTSWPEAHPAEFLGLIAVLALSGFVLGIVFMYVSSVMRFVLFDSVLKKECHIRAGWSARQTEGWKLFVFRLLFSLIFFVIIGMIVAVPLLIGATAGWWKNPGQHIGGWLLIGAPAFLILLAVIFIGALIYVLTKDFVVPQLALEDISVMEGWRRLWRSMEPEKSSFAAYIGMKILLAIAVGIVVGIATVIIALIMVIPVVGAVVAARVGGLDWTPGTITLAIVGGATLFLLLMFVISLISVPAIVFFPAYAMYFWASRYQKLASLVWPPMPAAPGPPPILQPPPSAEPIG